MIGLFEVCEFPGLIFLIGRVMSDCYFFPVLELVFVLSLVLFHRNFIETELAISKHAPLSHAMITKEKIEKVGCEEGCN